MAAVGLAATMLAGSGSAAPAPDPSAGNKYDTHLRNHLGYPALERAEEFVSRQERLGTRPAAVPDADYGRAGCEPQQSYEVGDERQFWVSQQQLGNIQIDAVLAAKGEHGYVWVQKEFYIPGGPALPEGGFVTQTEAEEASKDWDKIYDVNRTYFGKEPNPNYDAVNLAPGLPRDWRDADCDPRVHVLNFPIDAPVVNGALGYVAGYFSSEHEYPNGDGEHQSPFSNEAEMFFMNSAFLDVGDDTYAGVLAHEFFHMIQFSNDYNEETWVNEGMADIAAVVNDFADVVDGHISAYEEEPDASLTDWTSDVSDYGQAFLYFDYLFNHYGGREKAGTEAKEAYLPLAKILTRTKDDGFAGITKVLNKRSRKVERGLPRYFRSGGAGKVYKDYIVANYVDDPKLAAGQFGYANRDVAVAKAHEEDKAPDGSPEDSTVHPYGADYFEFDGSGRLSSEIEDPVAIIPAKEGQPAPEGGYFAWGNRGDEMITFLQRKADLSDATAPQLVFKYWHQIEEDWDYAYVRVSNDGGDTWEFLNTSECGGRATDPNGNNRATTESGGITGDSEGWQECTLDLADYTGGPLLVRFEYDTDQAVTEPGFVVDDVKLADGGNELWKTEKFEDADTPFTFGGEGIKEFLRIEPLAPNQPLLEVVRLSGGEVERQVLRRRAFDAAGPGLSLRRRARVAGERTIVIFSATTPIATTPFGYSYEVTR